MRFRRDADKNEDQLDEETATDQNNAISTSIRDLHYKLKYFNIP